MALLSLLLAISPVERANQLYRDGKFQDAFAIYDSLVSSGIKNPYLYYNLGNTCYRLNKKGYALLYYLKAFYYIPYDVDLRHNINLLTGEAVSKNPLLRFLKKTLYSMNIGQWLMLFLILFALFSILISLFILKRVESFLWVSLIFLIISFIPLSFSLYWMKELNSHQAVVVETAEARSGPGENFQKLVEFSEATPCRILRREAGWVLITRGGGSGGWVKEEHVKEVNPRYGDTNIHQGENKGRCSEGA